MINPIYLHQNDKGITLTFLCRDEKGNPIDLSQFSVDFLLYDGDIQVNNGQSLCTKPAAASGVAEYSVTQTDTQNEGLFHGKLRLSNASSDISNLGTIPVEVLSPQA